MKIKYLIAPLLSLLFASSLYSKQTVTIGVLAHKGLENTQKSWQPTADYLNKQLPSYAFQIKPLKFEEFPSSLRDKTIDFVITNSAYYVELESKYGISRIATLKNRDYNNKPQTEFGGVIFTKASNQKIKTIEEISGKKFAAVDSNSFGGWIMALRELKEHGLREKNIKVSFFGTHENVVYAVLQGEAEVGTVRSDTLERMASDGKINLNDFAIVNQKNYSNFFYLASTRLYPEWPFAKTKHIQDELAENIAVSLISMPENSQAAISSNSFGWTIPLDYQSIHECLKELELGPYAYLKNATFSYFLEKYAAYIAIFASLFVVSVLTALYIGSVNKRLRETRASLRTLNEELEDKVALKTQNLYEKSIELETAYQNEKYLRSVLRTVADVNQILITSRSLDELLERSALCLSSNESLKSAKISLAENGILQVKASYGVGDERVITEIEEKVYATNKHLMITNFEDKSVPEYCREKAYKYGIKAVYALVLRSDSFSKETLGVLTICTSFEHGFSSEEQNMIEELAGDIGFAVNSFTQKNIIETLHEEKLKSHQDFIGAMVNMIEQRDTYTAGHTERVSHYSYLIAKELELPQSEIQKLIEAAKLHDIGKVITPDSILLKPSALNNLEYELIKDHVVAGYAVLSTVHFYKELADVVIYHHERFDGSGYPHGKKGGEIPLLGHILAVADSFDAMTTNRIYKPRKSLEESIKELNELSGKWYHPAVVNAASKALANVEIDKDINQLGSTAIDEERLSYFFKDRLTKLYNEDYFILTLNNRARHPRPQKLCVISLINFTKYNREHTWEGGNSLLIEFATYLSRSLPDFLIFRVWGDRFIIADFDGDIESILSNSILNTKAIAYRTKNIVDIPNSTKDILSEW
jgi:two-component system, LuxR family, sensor histidine kinase TtrS